jgi:acetyl esterase/lipase
VRTDPQAAVTGGGMVPLGPSLADDPKLKFAGKMLGLWPYIPRPLRDRLLPAIQPTGWSAKKVPPSIRVSRRSAGEVPTTWLGEAPALRGSLVYVHGGAYIFGPFQDQWEWLTEIHLRSGLAAAAILYRMPPRHPFPAALEDSVNAITAMHAEGDLADGSWVLAGDSAGGGLALATAQALRDAGGPMPAGLMLTAPWTDLEMNNPELDVSEASDSLLRRKWLRWAARLYSDGVPLDDPSLSPINGSMAGLPPVHLDVGTRDLFRPDVHRLRVKLQEADVDVTFIEQEGGVHGYPQKTTTPEAEWTIRSQAQWLCERVPAETSH